MSVERAREFLQEVTADPALQARIAGAGNPEAVPEVMRAAGYGDVTVEDLKALVSPGAGGELTDEALDAAAGGVIPFFIGMGIGAAAKMIYDYATYKP